MQQWIDVSYADGYDQLPPEAREQKRLSLLFFRHRTLLEEAADPVAALRTYLKQQGDEEGVD